MSGIYIPGMEMPNNCEECDIKTWDTEDYVCPFSGVSTLCISRQSDCPLVAVPDHGRLIDADEFYADINESVLLTDGFKELFNLWFDEQSTIIPADKEGEN